jgi:hypothetical protein
MAKFRTAVLNELTKLVKELGVVLKDLTFTDNFTNFETVDLALPANTETKIRNEMNIVPTKMLIVKQTGNALITAGDTAWDSNFLYIKNHDASNAATATIIFLR